MSGEELAELRWPDAFEAVDVDLEGADGGRWCCIDCGASNHLELWVHDATAWGELDVASGEVQLATIDDYDDATQSVVLCSECDGGEAVLGRACEVRRG